MADQFGELNNIQISMLYYLETSFATEWPGINIVESFEQVSQTSLPVICVELVSEEDRRLEVGGNTLLSDYLIVSNIFAVSNTQRKSLSQILKDKIKEGCIYYTHTSSGGELIRVEAGRLTMRKILTNAKIDFGDNVEGHDHFRHNLSFTVRKNY